MKAMSYAINLAAYSVAKKELVQVMASIQLLHDKEIKEV